jgi:hypothetical protein
MAYISYKDVPIYLGATPNTTGLPDYNEDSAIIIRAESVQLSYSPSLTPVRLLGKTPNANNYNLSGPSVTKLSFSTYLHASPGDSNFSYEFNPQNYTGALNLGTTFRLGGNDPGSTSGIYGSGAFLTSYSFTCTPYQPILLQCEFDVYNPITTTSSGQGINKQTQQNFFLSSDIREFAHGAYSTFTSSVLSGSIGTYESFTYQYTCERLPIYEIGSFYPSTVEFITAEQTFSLEADNVVPLVPITGQNVALNIYLKNAVYEDPGDAAITIPMSGRILQENVNVQAGDFARGSISINQILK